MKPKKEIRTTIKGKTLFLTGNWSGLKVGPLPADVSGRMQVSVHSGWESDGSIEFLRTASGVTDLKLISLKKLNLEPLATLVDLDTLTVHLHANYVQRFHFGVLNMLKTLDITWNEGFSGVWQSPVLDSLKVDGIKKDKTIDVSLMKSLRILSIRNSRSVQRLDIGEVKTLQKLSLLLLPKLKSIQGTYFGDSVTHLSVTGLKELDPKCLQVFEALRIVEVGMRDSLTRQDFRCVPEHFLKLP